MPDGRIEKLHLGNGLWESAKFDPARGQVTELALGTTAGDGSLWKLNYEYGELNTDGTTVNAAKNTGNIAKQTLSFNGLAQPLVQTYRYDSLYRLKEARETSGATTTAPQTWKQVFDYDRFGNRTQYQKFVGTSQITLDSIATPSVNPQMNRLTTPGYSYDKNGNVIVDAQGRQFTFNGDNKQIEVKNASNVLVGKYYYDGEGKRVKKKTYDPYGVEQEETVFIYDGMSKLVAEYSTAPPPANPTTSYTATDQLGSPRVITNSLGEVISRRDFQPFGEELSPDTTYRKTSDKYGSADSVRQRFTGYQKDEETGLDFAEARMYENRHGRFTAVDPLLASGKSANPQTFNRYVYVMNNPLAYTDPNGEYPVYVRKYTEKVGKRSTTISFFGTKKCSTCQLYRGGTKTFNQNGQRVTVTRDSITVSGRARTNPSSSQSTSASDSGGVNPNGQALIQELGRRGPAMLNVTTVMAGPVAVAALPVTGPATALAPIVAGSGAGIVGVQALAGASGSDSTSSGGTPTPTPTASPTPYLWGPYYRAQSTKEPDIVIETGELWGHAPFNSNTMPAVQAHGTLWLNNQYEFYTPVKPHNPDSKGVIFWYQGDPGVNDVDEDTVSIPVTVTGVDCNCDERP